MRIARICRSSREPAGGRIDGIAGAAMLIVRPDFDRRIDLPGAGPCPRPVDIDRSSTGFSNLVSLRVYSFASGVVIDGDAEEDEVFIVLMRGLADVAVSSDGAQAGVFTLRVEGGARAVYMPPHASYRLTAVGDCDIAYARVQPISAPLPVAAGFGGTEDRLELIGYATGMDLTLATVGAGEHVGRDRSSPERFVHVRSDDQGTATLAGQRLGDWDSAALAEGESFSLEGQTGTVDVLTVIASRHRSMTKEPL